MQHLHRVWPEISSLGSYNTKKIGQGCIVHYLSYPLILNMKQYGPAPLCRFPQKLSTSVPHRLEGVAASLRPVSLIQRIPAEKICKQLLLYCVLNRSCPMSSSTRWSSNPSLSWRCCSFWCCWFLRAWQTEAKQVERMTRPFTPSSSPSKSVLPRLASFNIRT